MVASWQAVCVTHCQEHTISFWGHGSYPEFLRLEIRIWPAFRFCCIGGLSMY